MFFKQAVSIFLPRNSINRLIYGIMPPMQKIPSPNTQQPKPCKPKKAQVKMAVPPTTKTKSVVVDKCRLAATAPKAPNKAAEDNAARARLLREALRLFAAQGFAKTSTRAIAQAANVNISAISYYFGNKQGLYRSAYYEPMAQRSPQKAAAQIADSALSLEQALQVFFEYMLVPFAQDDVMCDSVRLQLREMLEPTGLWEEVIAQRISLLHDALGRRIAQQLELKQADDEIQRLVFACVAMPVHFIVGHDIVLSLAPNLLQQRNAIPKAIDAMVRYGMALIESEKQHRLV